MLNSSYRWVEAIREYYRALQFDPKNGVVAGGIIKQIILGYKRTAIDDRGLSLMIPQLYKTVVNNAEYTASLCGLNEYERMLSQFEDWNIPSIRSKSIEVMRKRLSAYQQFVFINELSLSPFMTRELFIPDLCDSLQIQQFIPKSKQKSYSVPPIFGMFNVIKADFLTTRWLAFNYFSADLPKNSFYHDTLDYAIYGTKPSLLAITQRLAFDILDKIAAAVLSIIEDPTCSKVYFRDAWFKKNDKCSQWPNKLNPLVEKEIEQGNRAFLALSELAFDIYDYYQDGCSYLKRKHKLRNSSTHRFTVFHDIGIADSSPHSAIDHYALEEIESELIDTLFIVKAAIFYFIDVIYFQNGILESERNSMFGTLDVLSHKWIRGMKS